MLFILNFIASPYLWHGSMTHLKLFLIFRLYRKDNGQQMLCFSILVRRRKTIYLCFVFVWWEVVCDNI